MATHDSDRPIRILHLSDFHFRAGQAWDADPVLQGLPPFLAAEAEGADWRVALLHHPWDYLAEFDVREAREFVYRHRDLLLLGHLKWTPKIGQ